MEPNVKLFMFTAALCSFILGLFLLFKRRPTRHDRNITTSKKLLQKLENFEHDGQKINYLRKIDPFVFEELLLTAYERKGFKIKRNKKYTGDGGIDGSFVNEKGDFNLIQAKRYSNYINPKHIETFSQMVRKKKASKGYFIHTGRTSPATREAFRHSNVILIGGSRLLQLIQS